MKELQKYYTGSHLDAMYLAAEADAAFAETRREHAEDRARIDGAVRATDAKMQIVVAENERLKREHAEEVERLKAELESMTQEFREQFEAIDLQNERLRKQAERYQKLKGIGSRSLERLLWQSLDDPASFDALVDQLPASGEAQKQPKTLLDFGYAPGDYFSTCLTCNSQIQDVDKRCYCCKPCAQAKLDKWNGREAQK